MFTVFKVREGLARNDYRDPGWYQHPPGTVAYEWKGEAPRADRAPDVSTAAGPTISVRKPGGHSQH
jgi:manganese oxidase